MIKSATAGSAPECQGARRPAPLLGSGATRSAFPASVEAGPLVEWSTAHLPAADRFAYWRDEVMRRNEPTACLDGQGRFNARMRIISAGGAHLLEHASSAIAGERSASRCASDGVDDIVLDLMLTKGRAVLQTGDRQLPHRAGDLVIVDQARPSALVRPRHRAIGLILDRASVTRAIGHDPGVLSGRRLPSSGMAALLRSHLIATMTEIDELDAGQRNAALEAATGMALSALRGEALPAPEAPPFEAGIYVAARRLIEARCGNSSLDPTAVATALNCSRASLYRLFAKHGETVGRVIWDCRLERAERLLADHDNLTVPIAEIAFRCGFSDPATFGRMFRQRFAMTPRDARPLVAGLV